MRVTIGGARGSTPAPGAPFVGTGGHTSCVAVAHDGRLPVLLLDAGTGLRRVTSLLGGAPFRGTIVLTHLHWDHVTGLPFFAAGDRADAEVTVLVPPGSAPSAFQELAGVMRPPYFPIGPDQLEGRWTLEWSRCAQQVEGFDVQLRELPHSSSTTLGVRVTDPSGRSLAYLPDHAPHVMGPGRAGRGALHAAALELADGVDVLLHDAHFTPAELARFPHYGHSCAEYAIDLAEAAGVHRVVLFHHHPDRTDAQLAEIVAGLDGGRGVSVVAATEGLVIEP